jgi:hypothetical protein
MSIQLSFAISVAWFLASAISLLGAEHPVQQPPQFQQFSQIPDQPPQSTPTTIREVSKADIAVGIKRHIASERRKFSDKKFHLKYQGKDLALDLIKVHDDRLSSLGGNKYFACVDMKGKDDTVFDIDFFMAGQPGNMKVTETSVHKINGKPLYDWKEKGGVWKKLRIS